jgi:hypothetical protein
MSSKNTKTVPEEELTKIKNKLEIEGTRNAKNIVVSENITDQKIKDVLTDGMKNFEEETGRPMTYSELREMYG